jgi:hypothetical protein
MYRGILIAYDGAESARKAFDAPLDRQADRQVLVGR